MDRVRSRHVPFVDCDHRQKEGRNDRECVAGNGLVRFVCDELFRHELFQSLSLILKIMEFSTKTNRSTDEE